MLIMVNIVKLMFYKFNTKLSIFKLFDTNSSIFSYLRYRQYLLFLYLFCIFIVVFLFLNAMVIYGTSSIIHLNFVGDSFPATNMKFLYSKSLSGLLLSDVSSWLYQNRLLDIYDNYILCLAYMSNLNEVSYTSYLLSYNLGGWFETCQVCLDTTQFISRITNTDELTILGMVLDFEINNFGSFINKDYCDINPYFKCDLLPCRMQLPCADFTHLLPHFMGSTLCSEGTVSQSFENSDCHSFHSDICQWDRYTGDEVVGLDDSYLYQELPSPASWRYSPTSERCNGQYFIQMAGRRYVMYTPYVYNIGGPRALVCVTNCNMGKSFGNNYLYDYLTIMHTKYSTTQGIEPFRGKHCVPLICGPKILSVSSTLSSVIEDMDNSPGPLVSNCNKVGKPDLSDLNSNRNLSSGLDNMNDSPSSLGSNCNSAVYSEVNDLATLVSENDINYINDKIYAILDGNYIGSERRYNAFSSTYAARMAECEASAVSKGTWSFDSMMAAHNKILDNLKVKGHCIYHFMRWEDIETIQRYLKLAYKLRYEPDCVGIKGEILYFRWLDGHYNKEEPN